MALIEYDVYKQKLREMEPELDKLSAALDIESAKQEAARLEDETAQGIAETLGSVLSQTEDALFEKGQAARHFILNEKNNVIQAQKILDMLETR